MVYSLVKCKDFIDHIDFFEYCNFIFLIYFVLGLIARTCRTRAIKWADGGEKTWEKHTDSGL